MAKEVMIEIDASRLQRGLAIAELTALRFEARRLVGRINDRLDELRDPEPRVEVHLHGCGSRRRAPQRTA